MAIGDEDGASDQDRGLGMAMVMAIGVGDGDRGTHVSPWSYKEYYLHNPAPPTTTTYLWGSALLPSLTPKPIPIPHPSRGQICKTRVTLHSSLEE